ncbi:MAG TPA: 2-dehydropantoate 2-reductase [Candidatus Binataceae bacterium]|nr:2-dehydropantoate 2-reductase [Candidatus Binataceae bacterium]
MWQGPILIAGAGAIGSTIGTLLQLAGDQVTLLGRAAHLQAIDRDGLRLEGLFGSHRAHGFALVDNLDALAGRRFSLIILAVKSYDTAAFASHLGALLAEDGIVVAAQNGLGNLEQLARYLGAGRLLGARVIFGAELAPARVRVTVFAEPVALGPSPDLSGTASTALYASAQRLSAHLTQAGIPSEASTDIRPLLWTKLFYNAALNPLGALLRTHYGALGADPALRRIMDGVIEEAFAVAHRLEIALPFANADAYREAFYGRLVPITYDHRPSMLVDLEQRGRTEIDALNGRIVALGDELGLAVEINRTLTDLIKACERLRQSAREHRQ